VKVELGAVTEPNSFVDVPPVTVSVMLPVAEKV
jgi:hypothetical protein